MPVLTLPTTAEGGTDPALEQVVAIPAKELRHQIRLYLNGSEFFDEGMARMAGILRERLARLAIDRLVQHFEEARVAAASMTSRMVGAGDQPAQFHQGLSCCPKS